MKFFTVASLLSLATTALAFESTVPVLMWSPGNYISKEQNVDSFIVKTDAVSSVMRSLPESVCQAKLIALINQPEIHVNDFTRYEDAFTNLKEQNKKAKSSTQIKYISNGVDVEEIAKDVATLCGRPIAFLDATNISSEDLTNKPVAVISLPAANDDVTILKENDALLGNLIQSFEETVQDDYLVIYTSSNAKAPSKRQTVYSDLPIFAKYQLFTPGVFMVLGVVILFLFILGTGITWLVGIQTPVRFEAKQKKN